jgi:hypothetical protein
MPIANGVFTGFQPTNVTRNDTGLVTFKTATFEVASESPLWFYSGQTNECQKGMVFAVNTNPATFKEFEMAAMNKTQNIAPTTGPMYVSFGLVERYIAPHHHNHTMSH